MVKFTARVMVLKVKLRVKLNKIITITVTITITVLSRHGKSRLRHENVISTVSKVSKDTFYFH